MFTMTGSRGGPASGQARARLHIRKKPILSSRQCDRTRERAEGLLLLLHYLDASQEMPH
jgi:hypothetical protein